MRITSSGLVNTPFTPVEAASWSASLRDTDELADDHFLLDVTATRVPGTIDFVALLLAPFFVFKVVEGLTMVLDFPCFWARGLRARSQSAVLLFARRCPPGVGFGVSVCVYLPVRREGTTPRSTFTRTRTQEKSRASNRGQLGHVYTCQKADASSVYLVQFPFEVHSARPYRAGLLNFTLAGWGAASVSMAVRRVWRVILSNVRLPPTR